MRQRQSGYQRGATPPPQQPAMSNRLGAGTPVGTQQGDMIEPSRGSRGTAPQPLPTSWEGDTYNKDGMPEMSNRMEGTPVDDPFAGAPGGNPGGAPGYQRYSGDNVGDMITNDRNFAYGRGDELFQNAKDNTSNNERIKENYRSYGDEVYDPLIGGRGGYNPDEASRIDRSGEFDQYMTGDEGYDSNFLTGDETGAILGNPWERAAYFNPEAADAQQNESAARQRGAVDDMQRGMYESLDGQLGLSDEYSQGVDRTLSGTADRTRGSYDPASLRADKTSLDRIKMTPEEEAMIVTKAGIDGGAKYRSAAGELDRRNRAAGGDPIAGAAMRGRYLRDAAGDAADAMTSARVAASNARAGREGTAENLRMGGERTAADIGTGVELSLGNQALQANTTKEGLRLGSQRDIADRRMDIATTAGRAKLDAETGINSQQRQVGQFNTTTGTGIATGIERDAAERAKEVAANRQTTNRANQTQKFNQGTTRIGGSSQMAQTVANARRDDAKEGRGYIRDQQTQANANAQAGMNRQANIYATQGQLGQGATNTAQKKDAQPKWWEKVIAAGAQAAGAAAGVP
jgi:hypothetical protein